MPRTDIADVDRLRPHLSRLAHLDGAPLFLAEGLHLAWSSGVRDAVRLVDETAATCRWNCWNRQARSARLPENTEGVVVIYIRVAWKHSNGACPVMLYSELDEERRETRKVEVFADGRMGYADARETEGDTALGLEPVPPLAEIAKDPQFEPIETSREDFEHIWASRRSGARS